MADNDYREPVSRGIVHRAENGTVDESVRDAAVRRAIDEMFSSDDIAIKTDLTKRQILSIARGLFYAERYDSEVMRTFINHVLTLSVSKNRKSRDEFVRLIRAAQETVVAEEDSSGKLRRMLGM